jgi:quercetin dioxygenase-like cupin family protein
MTDPSERFAVFRAADAIDFDASGAMSPPEPGTFDLQAVSALLDAGIGAGAEHELVFSGGGMSLARVWFKSGYPLPRHSHDCACLYYILAGGLILGTERLGPGDGFFVDAGVPYAYTAGETGVELLEFRSETRFGIQLLGMTLGWAQKAAARVRSRSPAWADEQRPSRRD